jgi:hypothetical protein
MELDAIKTKIHKAVDASDNLEKLSLISKVLEQILEKDDDNLYWEESADFQNELQKSIDEADRGEVSENEEVMERVKMRSWRTK